MDYVCSKCGSRSPSSTRAPRCACGGLWELDFRPPKFDFALVDRAAWSIFRYRAFLPLEGETWRRVSLGEGLTPIIPFGDGLLLKLDYAMPTLSFKDRGAAVLVALCAALGVESVIQDSSGNAGNSVAAYCGRAGIACEIFVPEGTSPKKIAMIASHGAQVTVTPGNRDQCAAACRAKVEATGSFYASHVFNPFFYEGTKTYLYEVYEELGRIPSTLFIPVGNGTLFLGVVKALEEFRDAGLITDFPRIVAVQSERCDPLARAAEAGKPNPARIEPGPTLAEGIAIGEPLRGEAILEKLRAHGMETFRAPEDRILEARASLARQGFYVEHTTAATYAAYLAYSEQRGSPEDCLLPLCGAGLKSDK